MSDSGEDTIQEIIQSIDIQLDKIADNLENADNLEIPDIQKLETEEDFKYEPAPYVIDDKTQESETQESETQKPETQKSDNLENAETQKPEIETFTAEDVYNTTSPISNAILHRMHKIKIQNENLKEYYINNLITSIIRDVIGHAQRRLTTIRYTSLGITKQTDDIYKAKGLYKENEIFLIKQTLQKKFPSADIKITKQPPLSEYHIPVHFEISWVALDLGEEVEEEIPEAPVAAPVPVSKNAVIEPKPEIIETKVNVIKSVIQNTPVLTEEDKEKLEKRRQKQQELEKKEHELQLNKDMNADYAIQKFLLRKRRA